MAEYSKEIKNLIKERLRTIPSNVRFSVGSYGDFTRDQLIHEIDINSEIGKDAIEMQLEFIRRMPTLLND